MGARPQAILLAAVLVAGAGTVAAVAEGDGDTTGSGGATESADGAPTTTGGATTSTGPSTSMPPGATDTTGPAGTPNLPTPSPVGPVTDPADALAEVTAATQRIFSGSSSRWVERRIEGGQLTSTIHGAYATAPGLLELRIVLAAGPPATVEDPHLTIINERVSPTPGEPIVDTRSVIYVDETPGAPAHWVRAMEDALFSHPELRSAATITPGTAVGPLAGLPVNAVLGARSATFTHEDEAGRHFDVELNGVGVLPMLTVAQFNAVLGGGGRTPDSNRLTDSYVATAVVRFGYLQTLRVDLSPLLDMLPGDGPNAPPGTLVAEFELVDVNDPLTIDVPTDVVDV